MSFVEDKPTAAVTPSPTATPASTPTLTPAATPTPCIDELPYFPEKYPGKLCCLCNLGERSALGQGEFLRIETSGTTTSTTPMQETIEDKTHVPVDIKRENVNAQNAFKRQKSANKNKAVVNNESNNELDKVGHSEVQTVQSLMDGIYLYVHRMCAMWSLGVNRNADDVINIEQIAEASLKRKCTFCGQYGASVSCQISCMRVFHQPCAAAAGSFLIFETFTIFCSEHLSQVPNICTESHINCRQCSSLGDISKLIMCSSCGDHYHTNCIGLVNLPDTRTGWNCSICSKCQICRQSDTSEGRSVKCEQCQKLYHATCLRPIISSIPKFGWKCNRCRVCTDCGSRTPGAGTSSRWHCHYTICDSCYQQRNKGFSCPICHKAYRAAAHKEMVKCSCCNRFVHSTCDSEADLSVYYKKKENNPDYDYICPSCKSILYNDKNQLNSHLSSDSSDMQSLMASQFADMIDGDSMDKATLDMFTNEDKMMMKKRLNIKELQRSRGGKMIFSKPNNFVTFGKKRARGKGRQFMPMSGSVIGAASAVGNNNSAAERNINRSLEDELAMEKKLLLCSAKDKFVLTQDICVMCGSLGMDLESCLISCVQCGQCYHPYCVNVKLSKVMLQKGWRCLDCTICEGCGQKNDEARLILCDECDISYHIYCMNPPLDMVPHGNWKCKWCSICQYCGRYAPSKTSFIKNGQLECAPCASRSTCCVCHQTYTDNDLIIQCCTCERWLHGFCDSINEEKDAQHYDNVEYQCILCRPKEKPSAHVLALKAASKVDASPKQSSQTHQIQAQTKSNLPVGNNSAHNIENETLHWIDGVCVNDHGLNMIKGLSTEFKRKRKMRPVNDMTGKDGLSAAIDSIVSNNFSEQGVDNDSPTIVKQENYKDGMIWTEGACPDGFSISTNDEGVNILRKKRQRNLQKVGIGGFNVRNRGIKKDADDALNTAGFSHMDSEKKKKLARKKLKVKLTETYPLYLQEAFFGKTLMDSEVNTNEPFEESDSEEECDTTLGLDLPAERKPLLTALKQQVSINSTSTPNTPVDNKNSLQLRLAIEAQNAAVASSTAAGPLTPTQQQSGNYAHTTHRLIENIKQEVQVPGEQNEIGYQRVQTMLTQTSSSGVDVRDSGACLPLKSNDSFNSMEMTGELNNLLQSTINTCPPANVSSHTANMAMEQQVKSPAAEMPSGNQLRMTIKTEPSDQNVRAVPMPKMGTDATVLQHNLMLNQRPYQTTNLILQQQQQQQHKVQGDDRSSQLKMPMQQTQQIQQTVVQQLPQQHMQQEQFMQQQQQQQLTQQQQQQLAHQQQLQLSQQQLTHPLQLQQQQQQQLQQLQQQQLQMQQQQKLQLQQKQLQQQQQMQLQQQQIQIHQQQQQLLQQQQISQMQSQASLQAPPHVQSQQLLQQQQQLQHQQQQHHQLAVQQTSGMTNTKVLTTSIVSAPAGSSISVAPPSADEPMEGIVAGTQKTAEKMRRDEDLGLMATISAVLYANTNHPELKQIYPNWNDRCKQILKRWRSLSTEKKAPFLQHAKDNRSALRMRRAQQDQEKICFQQKTLKEQEQERIWKLHQAKIKDAQNHPYPNANVLGYDSSLQTDPATGMMMDKRTAITTGTDFINTEQSFGMQNTTALGVAGVGSVSGVASLVDNNGMMLQQVNKRIDNVQYSVEESGDKHLRNLLQKQILTTSKAATTATWLPQTMQQQQQQQDLNKPVHKYPITAANVKTVTMSSETLQSMDPTYKPQQAQALNSPSAIQHQSHQQSVQQHLIKAEEQTIVATNATLGAAATINNTSTTETPTADLEKLEQDENATFGELLGGIGDDEDLLKSLTAEIGDDFNILEYADPELDELATNQNLLSNLDFVDTDKNT